MKGYHEMRKFFILIIVLMLCMTMTACQGRNSAPEASTTARKKSPAPSPTPVDYCAMYKQYLNEVLIPTKGMGKEMDFPLSQLGASSQQSINRMTPYVDGICSAYFKDFNSDNIPEMITVEIEKIMPENAPQSNVYQWFVYVDLYAIEKQTVIYKGRVYETEKFRNADERIFIYVLTVNSVPLFCIAENFWSGVSGSSVFGDKFKMYSIDSDNMAVMEQDIMYSYNRGTSSYRYNGKEYILTKKDIETDECQVAQSLIRDVFHSVGLDEFNQGTGANYCRFPDIVEHERIFSCGTEQSEPDDRIYVKNYTDAITLPDVQEPSTPEPTVKPSLAPSAVKFKLPQDIIELSELTLGDLYGTVPAPMGTYQGTQYYKPTQYSGLVVHFPIMAKTTDAAVLIECGIGKLFPGKESCTFQYLKDVFGGALSEASYDEMKPGFYTASVKWDGYLIEFEAFEKTQFETCSVYKLDASGLKRH